MNERNGASMPVANGDTSLPGIPDGWAWVRLADIAEIESGITKDQKKANGNDLREVPYLRVANVQRGFLDLAQVKTISATAEQIADLKLAPGDVLFTEGGDRDKLGRGWVWSGEIEECIHQDHIFRARLRDSQISPKDVSHYSNFHGQEWFSRTGKQTTNLASMNKRVLSQFPIALAPADEQRRIVAKIEELFSDLEAGVAVLERVRANLKRYRAAVLKAAVEGRLTEQWRAEHPDAEPASVLLERILTERRSRWEADQLARFEAAGKKPPKGWKDKYRQPAAPDTANLPELPKGWCWASLEAVCPVFVDCAHRTPEYSSEGVPALRPRDVVGGLLDLMQAAKVDESEWRKQTERRIPEPGDFIYSRELSFGWAVIVPPHTPVCMSQGMVLFRPDTCVDPGYLLLALNGPLGREQAKKAATGSAHPHINLGDIKSYAIPLAPVCEQRQAAELVAGLLGRWERVSSEVERVADRTTRLRQSILKQAFEGQLVDREELVGTRGLRDEQA